MKIKVKGDLLWTGDYYTELRLNGAVVGRIEKMVDGTWSGICSYRHIGHFETANEARVIVTTKFRKEAGIKNKTKWVRAFYTRDTLILAGGNGDSREGCALARK